MEDTKGNVLPLEFIMFYELASFIKDMHTQPDLSLVSLGYIMHLEETYVRVRMALLLSPS